MSTILFWIGLNKNLPDERQICCLLLVVPSLFKPLLRQYHPILFSALSYQEEYWMGLIGLIEISYEEPRRLPKKFIGWGGKKLQELKRKEGLGYRQQKVEIQLSLRSLIGVCTRKEKFCGLKSFGKSTTIIEGSMLATRTDCLAPRSRQP